eukprot:9123233-Ditylum_brightwellii.AAC.1
MGPEERGPGRKGEEQMGTYAGGGKKGDGDKEMEAYTGCGKKGDPLTEVYSPSPSPDQEISTTKMATVIVYKDINRNGVRDDDEPVVPGVTVSTLSENG